MLFIHCAFALLPSPLLSCCDWIVCVFRVPPHPSPGLEGSHPVTSMLVLRHVLNSRSPSPGTFSRASEPARTSGNLPPGDLGKPPPGCSWLVIPLPLFSGLLLKKKPLLLVTARGNCCVGVPRAPCLPHPPPTLVFLLEYPSPCFCSKQRGRLCFCLHLKPASISSPLWTWPSNPRALLGG